MGLKDEERKPRLLIILNRFVIGGQAVDTIPLAYELLCDFEILILYGEKEQDEIEPDYLRQQYPQLQLKKISHLRRSINPLTDVVAFFRLYRTIKTFQADIVHTHGAKSGFLGRLAAWVARIPVIVHTFHGHFFHSYFSKTISQVVAFIERLIGKITTGAVTLSETQRHDLANVYRILPEEKLRIIPLGFDFSNNINAAALRQAFRNAYNIGAEDVVIAIVGRIVPVKNHAFFIEVVQKILIERKITNVGFFIIGDGEMRPQVEAELERKNINYSTTGISNECKVVFTSWVSNMYEIMHGLDIITLTSMNEGTPLSIIEAQFFKKPVVCTDVGGVKDTLAPGASGYLVGETNIDGFTDKLEMLIKSADLREEMGQHGYDFVTNKYSKSKEVQTTRDFYFSLLRKKGISFQQTKKPIKQEH